MFPRTAAISALAALHAFAAASGPWPLAFERNMGQTEAESLFMGRSQGAAIHLAAGGISLASSHGVVRMRFDNANPAPRISGLRPQGTAHYLTGPENQWRTDIPLYKAVEYRNLYRGIDLVFYGTPAGLSTTSSWPPAAA
jgi:hypothetical protein